MEIDKIFGLPAHPLFVHFAVVLVPLAALAVAVAVARPAWQRALRPVVVFFSVSAFIAIAFAFGSGQKFDKRTDTLVPDTLQHHKDLAEITRPLVFVFMVLAIVWAVLGRRHEAAARRSEGETNGARSKQLVIASSVAVVLFGLLSTIWTVRTGHEGSKAVWKQTAELEPRK